MITANFTFYKDTPFTKFGDTIHFSSNTERDNHFNAGYYQTIEYGKDIPFNFIRDRNTLRVPLKNRDGTTKFTYNQFFGVNYCRWTQSDSNTIFYAMVLEHEYVNDDVVELRFMLDGFMMYTQASFFEGLRNLNVERQHLPTVWYNRYLPILRTNGDVLQTSTLQYIKQKFFILKPEYVTFTSAADLEVFPTKDSSVSTSDIKVPNVVTTDGVIYDQVISPLNIYTMLRTDFTKLMRDLKEYPWVSQNIRRISQVPANLVDLNNAVLIDLFGISRSYSIWKQLSGNSLKGQQLLNLATTNDELMGYHGLEVGQDEHLLRSGYTTLELHYSDGQSLALESQKLPSGGLKVNFDTVLGHENEFAVYPDNYNTNGNELGSTTASVPQGTGWREAIFIRHFDEIPVLLDQATLSQGSTANQTALAESKLLSNQVGNVFDSNADLQDRLFSAANVLGNLSLSSIAGGLSDEYEYYRQKQAEFADKEIQPAQVSDPSRTNSLAIANDYWGIYLKVGSIQSQEWDAVKRYYKAMGFYIGEAGSRIRSVTSMSIANYLRFSGRIDIPGAPKSVIDQISIICESGIRLWHPNGTGNPMLQDLANNRRVE